MMMMIMMMMMMMIKSLTSTTVLVNCIAASAVTQGHCNVATAIRSIDQLIENFKTNPKIVQRFNRSIRVYLSSTNFGGTHIVPSLRKRKMSSCYSLYQEHIPLITDALL